MLADLYLGFLLVVVVVYYITYVTTDCVGIHLKRSTCTRAIFAAFECLPVSPVACVPNLCKVTLSCSRQYSGILPIYWLKYISGLFHICGWLRDEQWGRWCAGDSLFL